jgi:glutathione S-transferase
MAKPQEAARDTWMARQKGIVARAIGQLEVDPPHKHVDIGSIAVACALGYLDFRYADEPWRPDAPRLTAWFSAFGQHNAIASTAPV